jgi:hypothetical protein
MRWAGTYFSLFPTRNFLQVPRVPRKKVLLRCGVSPVGGDFVWSVLIFKNWDSAKPLSSEKGRNAEIKV